MQKFSKNVKNYSMKNIDEEIEKNILKSEEDYNNGRVKDAEDVFKEWKDKYGI